MRHRRIRTALLAAAIVSAGASGVATAATPLGPEFQVNTATAGHQYRSRMAMNAAGNFVVTWVSPAQDGSGFGILAKRFDAAAAAVGGEFVVNTYTIDDQQLPAVSINESGIFVVVWRGGDQDGSSGGIFARRFSATGVALGAEFQVNTYTSGLQSAPDVAVGPAGGFFVVWESSGQDGSYTGVFARRHDAQGVPKSTEFQVNVITDGNQSSPRVVVVQPSDLIVLWSSNGNAIGRRLGSTGAEGVEFQLNAVTSSGATLPALTPTGDGGFFAAWQAGDSDSSGIFARRFDLEGSPLAAEFQVNTYTPGQQSDAEIAGNGTDFVVVWQSGDQDGDSQGIFARRVDAGGPLGAELQIHQYTPESQRAPSIGMGSNGAFVVVWDSERDGYGDGVFARRWSVLDLVPLDVDGDGETLALTDGVLVLRFLFGFTGTTLASGATGDDCTRCDGGSIATYLAGLGLTLDIDDDGELTALTDGLLVLRFLFGSTGTTLTAGAVDTDHCARCDAAAIESYLAGLI